MARPALDLRHVDVRRDGQHLLRDVDWTVAAGERWIVLGPNGSGKTTLLRLASASLHPSAGEVTVLGERVGEVDLRRLRPRIGLTSAALTDLLRPALAATDIVMCGKHAALEPWWHPYADDDRERAARLLAQLGCAGLERRAFGSLSSGERQRVLLARTLMAQPELLLLDEPTAGLDLAGREELVGRLADLAADPTTPPTVLVTHHVDEIPAGFGKLLLLREGEVVASGDIDHVLTAERLGDCFGVPLTLHRLGDRWHASGS